MHVLSQSGDGWMQATLCFNWLSSFHFVCSRTRCRKLWFSV